MILDIKSIKIYLISPGTGKYRDRAVTVFGRLLDEGFQNITVFKSIKGPTGTRSLTNTVLEIFKREMESTEPFFILEDDCAFLTRYDTIKVPDQWDCLYVGVSLWSYPYATDVLKIRNRPHIVANSPATIEPYNDQLVRIKGMTSAHAILYKSRDFMKTFIEKMDTISNHVDDCPHDLVFSTLHSSFQIYGLKQIMFYQDKTLGGQEDVTRLSYTGECYR